MSKRSVIIAAGGVGSRMKNPTPKQFLLLHDEPIIYRSIKAFQKADPSIEVVVSIAESHQKEWNELKDFFGIDAKTVIGGNERFNSIQNAINQCTGDLIAVHDAVRPNVSSTLILDLFHTAELTGAAIPVIELKHSLREITYDESKAVDRKKFRLVQTPQVFKSQILKLAYEQNYQSEFTDDASVVEACGQDIALVNGEENNIKITTPEDLKYLSFLMQP